MNFQLLDACVNNCGKNFHLEIASREFETEYKKLVSKSQPQIATKLKLCLKKWAEGDFKSDPQLSLIPALYAKMKQEGLDFSEPQTTVKREVQFSKDPNVVQSQQEAEDIAKAIELSLKEKTTSPKAQSYTPAAKSNQTSSLYPSMSTLSSSTSSGSAAASLTATSAAPNPQELRKVRALYDFEAAEDNELTFKAGEIIMVSEESDPNWWRGSNQRGEGYFPANFVTADLSMEPEDLMPKETKSSKKVQFESTQEIKQEQAAEINEETIDRLLFLLHEADPADPSQDSDEMLRLESVVNQMGPLIDSELERVDRKHAQLTQLSSDLIDTINIYHSLMQSDNMVANAYGSGGFNPQQQMYRPPGAIFSPNHSYGMNSMGSMPPMAGMMQYPPNINNFPQSANFQPPPANFPPNNNFPMYQAMPNTQQPSQNSLPMGQQQPPPQNMMPQVNGPPQMPHEHPQQQQQPPQHQQQMYPGMFSQMPLPNNPQMAPQSIQLQSPVQQIPNTIGQHPQMMQGQPQVPHHHMPQQMQGGNMAI